MTKRYHEQQKCKYCETLTRTRCDRCDAFICPEHRVYVTAPASFKRKFVFCPDCAKVANKKPHSPKRMNLDATDFLTDS